MVDSIIQVPPDSTGKKVQTYQNTIGANVVEAEAHVQVDTTGTPAPPGTAASPVRTDPTGTTTQPVSGTVTANAGTGVFDVTPATSVATDYLPARVTDGTAFIAPLAEATFTGRINTQGQKAMAASTPVVVASDQSVIPVSDNAGSLTVDSPVGTPTAVRQSDGAAFIDPRLIQGEVAHDAIDSGNPQKIGGKASLNEPTAVADADRVNAWFDQLGRAVILQGHSNPEAPVTVNGSAAGVSVIAAPGAGVSLYIMKGSIHNRGAEQVVSLRDGAAGTIRFTANLAADGGGTLFNFGSRGWKLTANTALVADIGAASADVNVTEYYIAA